jgi:hypothetical protein
MNKANLFLHITNYKVFTQNMHLFNEALRGFALALHRGRGDALLDGLRTSSITLIVVPIKELLRDKLPTREGQREKSK